MLLDQNIISIKGKPLFQRAKFKTPFTMNGQMHDMACFFYIVEGKYEIIEYHGAHKISSKEALVKKCGNFIANYLNNGIKSECEAIAIYLYPDLLNELYKNEIPSFLKNSPVKEGPRKILTNELIEKYISNLSMYFDNPSLIDEELAILKLKELILILLKSVEYENVRYFLSSLFQTEKLAFTSIIENNLFNQISMEQLAFICHRSLSTFKRDFKKIYGETPAKYIKNRRLDHASKLLTNTSDTISSIAYISGFQDPTTFSSSFQSKFNCSPSQFRLTQNRMFLNKTSN